MQDFQRAGRASSRIKQTLSRLGVDPRIVRRVAIVSYEAEMNIVIHSSSGGDIVVEVTPELVAVLAYDRGPGIPDIERAMQPGFSTAPDWIREMGFGAGMGLSNIQACVGRDVPGFPAPSGYAPGSRRLLDSRRKEGSNECSYAGSLRRWG